MSKFLKVRWLHEDADCPMLLYSEIGDNRMEIRKIELYSKKFPGYAFDDVEIGGSILGEAPYPEIEEIARNPQFIPEEITREEFEEIWQRVTTGQIV